MQRKHAKTLEALFARPPPGNLQWRDIEALFAELGAQIEEREGSRVLVRLFGERRVFHRPHPSPNTACHEKSDDHQRLSGHHRLRPGD